MDTKKRRRVALNTAPITKKWLQEQGYRCIEKTEHWNPWSHTRIDLWGIADFIAISPYGVITLVQSTTKTNRSSHVKKIHESEFWKERLQCPERFRCRIMLICWRKIQISPKRYTLEPTTETL